LTQAQAAEEAGIGKRTVERIEAGGDTQMGTPTTSHQNLRHRGNMDNLKLLNSFSVRKIFRSSESSILSTISVKNL